MVAGAPRQVTAADIPRPAMAVAIRRRAVTAADLHTVAARHTVDRRTAVVADTAVGGRHGR